MNRRGVIKAGMAMLVFPLAFLKSKRKSDELVVGKVISPLVIDPGTEWKVDSVSWKVTGPPPAFGTVTLTIRRRVDDEPVSPAFQLPELAAFSQSPVKPSGNGHK